MYGKSAEFFRHAPIYVALKLVNLYTYAAFLRARIVAVWLSLDGKVNSP